MSFIDKRPSKRDSLFEMYFTAAIIASFSLFILFSLQVNPNRIGIPKL